MESTPMDRRKADNGHGHSRAHPHGPGEGNQRILWTVFFLSASYMVLEIVGGFVTGSMALLADAGHMAIDTGAVALGLFAGWIARRPPTEAKTFGYYRAEILVALANGVLLVAAAIWILFEAWPRFWNPPEVEGGLMTVVAAGGLAVNLVSLYLMHRGSRESLNVRGVWLHILGDTLGSVAALGAGLCVWLFGWYLADPLLSVVLTLFIVLGAGRLLLDCVNVLLEGVPKHIDIGRVKRDLEAAEGVADVHDLHVWLVTSGLTALCAHVSVRDGTDHGQLLRTLISLLHERHGILHVTLQLEPPAFAHRHMHV